MTGALAPRERRLLGLGVVRARRSARSSLRGARSRSLDDGPRAASSTPSAARASAALRRLHLSLRMMTQLAWYADPAHWDECGYDGPWLGRVAVERGPPPDLGPSR